MPLNEMAMAVVLRQVGKHATAVFMYRGEPVGQISTRARQAALKRAGIDDFRWHDLRHTFATWHRQAGTPTHKLQRLGGWKTGAMVEQYAHIAPEAFSVRRQSPRRLRKLCELAKHHGHVRERDELSPSLAAVVARFCHYRNSTGSQVERCMQRWEREDNSLWRIALGVTLGILVAGVIGFFVRAWMAQAAIEQITQQANKMAIQQQQAARAAQDRALAEKAEQERAAAYAAGARQRAQTAATDAAMRRERAWAKYYKRSALCDVQPSNETMMKCANDHIRAKRQFDLDYEAGRL